MDNELNWLLSKLKERGTSNGIDSEGNDLDWERVLELSLHHRVYPLLYERLKTEPGAGIPEFVMSRLKVLYRTNALDMLQLAGESVRISRELSNRGVRALFLKGPTLSYELYGNLNQRTSRDLDIRIDLESLQGNLASIDRLMEEIGYVPHDAIPTVLNEWRWRQHHKAYRHPVLKIFVEIHWRLNPGPLKEPDFEELWKESRVSGLATCPVRYLGSTHLFYYLCMHGSRHGWFRLRWLMDIDVLLRRSDNWTAIGKKLRQYEAESIAGQAVLLASRILGTSIPEGMEMPHDARVERLFELAEEYILQTIDFQNSNEKKYLRKHAWHLFALKSSRHQLLYLLSLLHPYPVDRATLPLPQAMHVLYFPLRPFLWAWRKTTGRAVL